jgi:hypothetical protein
MQQINLQLSSVGFPQSVPPFVPPLHLSGTAVVWPAVFELPLPFSNTLSYHFVTTCHSYQLLVNFDSRNVFRSYRQ